jgi:hypothetical protein
VRACDPAAWASKLEQPSQTHSDNKKATTRGPHASLFVMANLLLALAGYSQKML